MSGDNGCSCGKPKLVPTIDLNLAPPYIGGNKYCRYCLNCGRRYFCAKSFFTNAAEKWVIPFGEKKPEEGFMCLADDCDQAIAGEPPECPSCGAEYVYD